MAPVMKFFLMVLVGLLVGIFNGAAGGASVFSFPMLVAVGLNPISAAITSAIGVSPANIFALISKRGEIKPIITEHAKALIACSLGALLGAIALIEVPEENFKRLVPLLLLIASCSLLIKVAPTLTALERRIEVSLMLAIGIYCGYFGPGQGVMVIAVLARDAGRSVAAVNISKNVIVGISNIPSICIFAFSGLVDWVLAAALLVGSGAGGYVGGRITNRFSRSTYKWIIFGVGLTSTFWFFYKYWIK